MKSKIVKSAFVDSLPVLSGYTVLGIGFGILLEKNGYGIIWAFLMSVFIFAGSMQYAAIELIVNASSILVAAITTLMVNARHLFYGISMIDKYKNAGAKKPYMIFALTDETYSLVCYPKFEDEKEQHSYCFLVSLFNHIYWVAGSVIGSIAGSALPFDTAGIEFSMTALFVSVVTEQWLNTKNHVPAVIGFLGSAACLIIFGRDSFLIPSMAVILAALTLTKGRDENA